MSAGLLLAVLSSCGWAVLDGIRKHLGRHLAAPVSVALLAAPQAVLLLSLTQLRGGFPQTSFRFWSITAGSAALNLVSNLLYMRAVQISPLSLTIPYLAFSPALILLTGWLLLGELPGAVGVVGVVLVAAGAYLLQGATGWLAPIRALARERGSLMMLGVSAIWGLTASMDKLVIREVPGPFYGGVVASFISLSTLGWIVAARRSLLRPAQSQIPWLAAGAVVAALSLWGQLASLETLYVSYTIAIKRAGMLLSVLVGHFVFGEEDLGRRLLGASVMVSGVVLIVFG